MSVAESESSARERELEMLVARMQSELTATSQKLVGVSEHDNLRRAYRLLMEQFELLRRRIFIAKAERADASQLELEFAKTKQKLDELAAKLGDAEVGVVVAGADGTESTEQEVGSRPAGKPSGKPKDKPKGRRNLAERDDLPERRIEIRDPELESKGTFIGWETSYKLGHQRPQAVRVVIARAKYKLPVEQPAASSQPDTLPEDATVVEQDGERFTVITAPLPRLIMSVLAKIDGRSIRFSEGQKGVSSRKPAASSAAAL